MLFVQAVSSFDSLHKMPRTLKHLVQTRPLATASSHENAWMKHTCLLTNETAHLKRWPAVWLQSAHTEQFPFRANNGWNMSLIGCKPLLKFNNLCLNYKYQYKKSIVPGPHLCQWQSSRKLEITFILFYSSYHNKDQKMLWSIVRNNKKSCQGAKSQPRIWQASLWKSITFIYSVCGCTYTRTHARGQSVGIGSFHPPGGSQGSNSGHKASW